LGGFKFRRQAVITPFIVDFLCPAKALAVEIDGDTHDAATDSQRDRKPATQGYRTIRFTNSDVMPNAEGVLTSILHALNTTPDRWIGRAHPNSSPEGEGLQNNQP
jgi:very-short-patch-repair endonuclease